MGRPRYMGSETSLTCSLDTGPYFAPMESILSIHFKLLLRYCFTLFSVIGICLQALHLTYKKLRLICPFAFLLSTPRSYMEWRDVKLHPFLTSTLGGEENVQLYAPTTLLPGKKQRYPFTRKSGWAPEPVWAL